MTAFALVAALALAVVFGIGDAPNASAALIASRTAGYRTSVVFAGAGHTLGAIVGGSAVVATTATLVHVEPGTVTSVYAAAAVGSVLVTATCARLRIPTSASFGLFGGLAGAAVAAEGVGAVQWGGRHGVVLILGGMVVSPLIGAGAGAALDRAARVGLHHATRRVVPAVRATIWTTSGLVALAGGANDGQKAMGVGVAVLLASGHLSDATVPLWLRLAVAALIGLGTALGGRRVVGAVASGIYREGLLEAGSAQASAAVVIGAATALGAPLSSSNVVASAVVGVGLDRRPRHVKWRFVTRLVVAWLGTAPLAAAVAAVLQVLLARL